MTRERWEQILFAHVRDEVVQDMLNEYVLELEAENAKLRKLVLHMYACMGNVDADGNHECFSCEYEGAGCDFADRMRDLGIEVC